MNVRESKSASFLSKSSKLNHHHHAQQQHGSQDIRPSSSISNSKASYSSSGVVGRNQTRAHHQGIHDRKGSNPDFGFLNKSKTTSSVTGTTSNPNWKSCRLCALTFKSPMEFSLHLREYHCTKEGGSFVCRYGLNGVCTTLPLEGVNDTDYDSHVAKEHSCISLCGKYLRPWLKLRSINLFDFLECNALGSDKNILNWDAKQNYSGQMVFKSEVLFRGKHFLAG